MPVPPPPATYRLPSVPRKTDRWWEALVKFPPLTGVFSKPGPDDPMFVSSPIL